MSYKMNELGKCYEIEQENTELNLAYRKMEDQYYNLVYKYQHLEAEYTGLKEKYKQLTGKKCKKQTKKY